MNGIQFLEKMRAPSGPALAGLLSGAFLVAGAVSAPLGDSWFLWGPMFALATFFAFKKA